MNQYNLTVGLLYKKFKKYMLTIEDMADLFEVSNTSIQNYIKNDNGSFVPHHKIGDKNSKGTIRFFINDVALYLSKHSLGEKDDNTKETK